MAFQLKNEYARFTGRKHKPESNKQRSESIKRLYAERKVPGMGFEAKYTEEERKAARREAAVRHKCKRYGITVEDYNRMLEEQNRVCAICRLSETAIDAQTNRIKNLAIDHCHISKKVRGLLCVQCNQLLGRAKDNISILEQAIKYLKENENENSTSTSQE